MQQLCLLVCSGPSAAPCVCTLAFLVCLHESLLCFLYMFKNYLVSHSHKASQADIWTLTFSLFSCSSFDICRVTNLFWLQNSVHQAQVAGRSGTDHEIDLAQDFLKMSKVMWQPEKSLSGGTIVSTALWPFLICDSVPARTATSTGSQQSGRGLNPGKSANQSPVSSEILWFSQVSLFSSSVSRKSLLAIIKADY